ncbi:MAG: winged helix-turn-helix domain-containing protein [archaeon]
MGWRTILGLEKKKEKKSVNKVSTVQKKPSKKPKTVTQSQVEDPMISFSRQLTMIQGEMQNIETIMQSGFTGLREDHHRILEEQEKAMEIKKGRLEQAKQNIENEIEMLEVDSKILNLLKIEKMQSVAISERLGVTRQYAATRLNELDRNGYLKKVKSGRKVYYKLNG